MFFCDGKRYKVIMKSGANLAHVFEKLKERGYENKRLVMLMNLG